jgi:D-methionine transport system permease protein
MPEFIAPIVADIVHRLPELLVSLSEPFLMVGIALAAAVLVGIPVGTLLYLTRKNGLIERPRLFALLDILVNVVRSFPFMILIVALIPVTRILLGTSLGTIAASVPLSIVAIVYYGRLVEQSLLDVDRGVITAVVSMGATLPEIVFKVLLVEARSGIVFGRVTLHRGRRLLREQSDGCLDIIGHRSRCVFFASSSFPDISMCIRDALPKSPAIERTRLTR